MGEQWLTKQDEDVAITMAKVFAIYEIQVKTMIIIAHHISQAIQPALVDFDRRLAEAMGTRRMYNG